MCNVFNEDIESRRCWLLNKFAWMKAVHIKWKDGLTFTKVGEKLGGCSWQGGLKNKPN